MSKKHGVDKHGGKIGYASRKFLLTIGLMVVTSIFLMSGLVIEATWKEVIVSSFSIFMLGHVGEKWALKDKNNNGIPDDQEVEVEAEPDPKPKPVVKKIELDEDGNPKE